MSGPVLILYSQDLRVQDHPALWHAAQQGRPVIPVYIAGTESKSTWPPGRAAQGWLRRSLHRLDQALQKKGLRLIMRQGNRRNVVQTLLHETQAKAVFWNQRIEPAAHQADLDLERFLRNKGVDVQTFEDGFLVSPHLIRTRGGKPFQVFTPFWHACQDHLPPSAPLGTLQRVMPPKTWPASLQIEELGFAPAAVLDDRLWQPGSSGASRQLNHFLRHLERYPRERDFPGVAGTSRLSPYLHFGEISIRTLWHRVSQRMAVDPGAGLQKGGEVFLRQLGWREFGRHLLVHFPKTPEQPLRQDYRQLPWRSSTQDLQRWQSGQTGFPLVDAGMRELAASGWMHNRVRMVVASFLTKDLLLSWQEGAKWFWDTLLDADLANNTLGWQWSAGCGADAQPFFRIFNPVVQGKRYDPQANYIRRWLPELAHLPDRWIHAPYLAPTAILKPAGIRLGQEYPRPMLEHSAARTRALQAFRRIRRQSSKRKRS